MNDDTLIQPSGTPATQTALTPNGITLNGIHPNGIHPNGIHPNGIHPNGIHPNGIHPNGIHPNGIHPNGIHPNGIHPNGIHPNGIHPNGIHPNGIHPNGIHPNGIHPNGIHPNGIHPNGVTLNGVSPTGTRANGASIAITGTGAPLTGAQLVGSAWTGSVSDGTTVTIRIDAATQGTGANSDLWFYRMSMSANETWEPACLDPTGRPIDAIGVRGTWNYAQGVPGGGSYDPSSPQFTIACRGTAIAKCVEHGYKPWTGASSELAACVRALRADYCGDGTPHTVDGTMVNIFDARGIQLDAAEWVPEAEWTPDGARCISGPQQTRSLRVAHRVPLCMDRLLAHREACGAGFAAGATIITELAPR